MAMILSTNFQKQITRVTDINDVYEHKKSLWSNHIYTFDIEVTSFFKCEGRWITSKGVDPKYISQTMTNQIAVPYIWQFGIDDTVFFGRDLREFPYFLAKLNEYIPYKKVIYVHNLSFEFSFLTQYFNFDMIFARKAHHVMFARDDIRGIEWRCSYYLSNMSLSNIAKSYPFINVNKTHGLDYEIARLPCTPLSEKEMEYTENDILIMYQYLNHMRSQYKNISDIPYTQTGVIRRHVKKNILNKKSHMRLMDLIKPNLETYRVLTRVFRGGVVECNYLYLNQEINNVFHVDFSSSYPAVMCLEYFPMGKWEWVYDRCNLFDNSYCYIYRIIIENLSSKTGWHYIATAKTEVRLNEPYPWQNKMDCIEGKICSAKKVELWCTDVDLEIIQKMYNGTVSIKGAMRSKKAFLPKEYVEYLLQVYAEKTQLKGSDGVIEGKEALYVHKKGENNGNFGMAVTNIFKNDVIYDGFNQWHDMADDMTEEEYIQNLRDKLDDDKPFLNFAWGVWITAYARKNLFDVLAEMGDFALYIDTDSIFFIDPFGINMKIVHEYNRKLNEKIKAVCNRRGLDIALFNPKNTDGEVCTLGAFDIDKKPIKRFRSIGSKKYAYVDGNGKFHAVVAGCKKKYYDFDEEKEINVIKDFDDFGTDRTYKNGRSVTWFTGKQPQTMLKDYQGNIYINRQITGQVILNTYYTSSDEEEQIIAHNQNTLTDYLRLEI